MRKYINMSITCLIFTFIFSHKVLAECSYKERTELLNSAKQVAINMNIATKEEERSALNEDTDEIESFIEEVNYFQLSISNMPTNIFAEITSVDDGTNVIVDPEYMDNGIFIHNIDDVENIINYKITFYSYNTNCYAEEITSKRIKKPKENHIYYYSICEKEEVKNHKYCKQFIENDSVSDSTIVDTLEKIIKTEESELITNKKTLKQYWFIPVIIIFILIGYLIYFKINKKRGELE